MNEQGASHFSHTKTTRVGRARKRSSWWRLAGKRFAGRSRSLCIIDEALCPSGGPSRSFTLPPLPFSAPPAWGSGLARVPRLARLRPAARRTQWGEADSALRAGGAGSSAWQSGCRSPCCRSAGAAALRWVAACARRPRARHPEGPVQEGPQRSWVIHLGSTVLRGRQVGRGDGMRRHPIPVFGSELRLLPENPWGAPQTS